MDITGEKPKDTNAVRHLLNTVWGGHGGTALKYEYHDELLSRHKPMNVKCKIHSQNCLIKMHTYRLQMSEMHIFKTFHKGFNFC